MTNNDYKKYTETARLGIDFLCEWIDGDRPTGILFSAQIKTSNVVKPKPGIKSELNGLIEFTLEGADKAEEKTIKYWKGLGLPAYLFYVLINGSSDANQPECYHKRYTPLLDGHPSTDDENGTRLFYKVNKGQKFLAFADPKNEIGGFARDLIIDLVRLSYSKGQIPPLTRRQLGFWPFEKKDEQDTVIFFGEMVGWHREKIEATCNLTTHILSLLPAQKGSEGKTGIPDS
jgi:hypothetical protein